MLPKAFYSFMVHLDALSYSRQVANTSNKRRPSTPVASPKKPDAPIASPKKIDANIATVNGWESIITCKCIQTDNLQKY
jgi:hypothetical protein